MKTRECERAQSSHLSSLCCGQGWGALLWRSKKPLPGRVRSSDDLFVLLSLHSLIDTFSSIHHAHESFKIYLCVVCVSCGCVSACIQPEEGAGSSGTRTTDNCELPETGAGSQTSVLCKLGLSF